MLRVSAGTQSRLSFLRTMIGKLTSRPRPLTIVGIACGVLLHVLIFGGVELPVLFAAVILALASTTGLRAKTQPYSYALPGMPDGPPRPSLIPPNVCDRVNYVAVATFISLQVFGLDPRLSFGPAIVVAITWIIGADAVIRNSWHTRRLIRAMSSYGATTGIGFAGRSGGPWQLRMWEPYLLRSGERLVIFNLHAKYLEMILKGGDLESPFIQLGSDPKADLDRLLNSGFKALFYVQNAQRNALFMAHKQITHVWLNHGDSDKPANFNPRHALYDHLVVCGQAGIDRYANHGIEVDPKKFQILGRPQASGIEPARGPIGDLVDPVVFYGPTWQGLDNAVNFSSLEKGPELVRTLIARGVAIIFRPHPLSYRWRIRRAVIHEIHGILEADAKTSGRKHVWGEQADKAWSVADCSNYADALVSDVSSVVSDFLQSNKPYAMMTMRASVEEFRAEFAVAETGYVILGDLTNLDEALDDMLGPDTLAATRSERKRYVLGDFIGQESAEAFARFVREVTGHAS